MQVWRQVKDAGLETDEGCRFGDRGKMQVPRQGKDAGLGTGEGCRFGDR